MSSTEKHTGWKPCFEYKVDYNDHFETPKVAYEDILPLLDGVKQNRTQHILYDPYYCNGRSASLLRQLGFTRVIHAKRDFYADIKENKVPQHDTLVTNPPYSEDHKEKCIEFCIKQYLEQKRAFFLLMPTYVAARNYFRQFLTEHNFLEDIAYLVPSKPYEYDHPEGTGHAVPPFNSLWFIGIGKDNINRIKESWVTSPGAPKLVTSLEELERLSVISTQRRPNPRQRKKRRTGLDPQASSTPKSSNHNNNLTKLPATTTKKIKKHSRYRDTSGKRTKKRF
eukprot:scaffold834_cov123-Cylindrotheca_fusiformis.AAC.7